MRVPVAVALIAAACACGERRATAPDSLPAPSAEIPPWFADPAAPAQRIAGHVYVGQEPAVATVHLRIATDPAAWVGVDLTSGPDGAFDLGARPPGPYLLLATAPGMASRVVDVDTRTGAAPDLSLFLHPCASRPGQLLDGIRPVAGARISLGGVALATTAADGTFALCAIKDPDGVDRVHLHAARYVSTGVFRERTGWFVDLERSVTVRGVVRHPDGSPAAGIGVQPNFDREHFHGTWLGFPTVATADAAGRFELRGMPDVMLDTFWLHDRGRRARREGSELVDVKRPLELVLDPAKVVDDRRERPWPHSPHVISGRVTQGGKALPDALVYAERGHEAFRRTRTDREGAFRLELYGSDGPFPLVVRHANGSSTARELPGGVAIDDLLLDLRPTSSIAGVAVAANGEPIAESGVVIRAEDTPLRTFATTDASGRFEMQLESGRDYELEIRCARAEVSLGEAPITDLRVVETKRFVLDERDVFSSREDGRPWKSAISEACR